MEGAYMKPIARKLIVTLIAAVGLLVLLLSLEALVAKAQNASPVRWAATFRLSDEARQAIEAAPEEALRSLADRGVARAMTESGLELAADGSPGDLRSVLFDALPPEVDLLGGAVLLSAHIPRAEASALDLSLQMRPGTGYRWEILPDAELPYAYSDQIQYSPMYAGDGAPAIQTFHLEPTGQGEATIRLLYQRPFEMSEDPHATLELWVASGTTLIELTDATPAAPGFSEARRRDEPGGKTEPTLDGLPTSWDWRTQGVVPAVRNQSSCGSCWAFATVGAMESALMRTAATTVDLSEQYLVSCNTDGWSCSGGGTAHPYHYNKLGLNQSAPGAVLEADKPYTATNGSCASAYSHPFVLNTWSYVAGWPNSSVDQLKDAIYTYGPIKVSVCADPGWNSYPGGVYSPPAGTAETYCEGGSNHAVVLVGWNDSESSWIVRNSWGASWGESGYMRMAWDPTYTTSVIGYNASWVTVPAAAPGSFGKSNPADLATDVATNAQLQWTSSSAAGYYEYCIDDTDDDDCTGWTSAATSLSASPALDPDTTYYWQVRARNGVGTTYADGSQTAFWSFTTASTETVASVLLVDDDDNVPDVRAYYEEALEALEVPYDVWDTGNSDNEPSAGTLGDYDAVVWFTGAEYGGSAGPGSTGEAELATYLNGGGCFLISSQDYRWDRGVTTFMAGHLGVGSTTNDVGQTVVTGAGTIFSGLGPYSLSYPFDNYSDMIAPNETAERAFSGNAGTPVDAGVDKETAAYRAAYLGFPIEALPDLAAREEVLEEFLEPCIREPYFEVSAYVNEVYAVGWPMDSWLTLEIDDPETPANPDHSETGQVTGTAPWDPSLSYLLFEDMDFDVQPGFLVSVTDGTTPKEHTVTVVEVIGYDLALNTLSGIASAGANVLTGACGDYGCPEVHVTADGTTGAWTSDLSPADLVAGDWVVAHEYDGDGDGTEFSLYLPEGPEKVLLVDDDHNGPDSQTYYTDALQGLGIGYDVWDTNDFTEPTIASISSYDAVLWYTGNMTYDSAGPNPGTEAALGTYLDGGGCFLVSSQEYTTSRGFTSFMDGYLGVGSLTANSYHGAVDGAGSIFGALGPYALSYPSLFHDSWNDVVGPDATAELAFSGDDGSDYAAVDKTGEGYVSAYLGFPIEALPDQAAREEVIGAFLESCGITPTDWIQREPMSVARSRTAAVAVSGEVYVLGGESASTSATGPKEGQLDGMVVDQATDSAWESTLEAYDPSSNTWAIRAFKPTGVSNIGAAVINNKIYVPGGFTGSAITDVLEVYNPADNTWASAASMPVPQFAHAVAAIGHKLYVMGGDDDSAVLNTCRVYDADANSWGSCGTMNYAREHAGAGVVNGKIYVVGGMDSSFTDVDYVEEFSPPSTWTVKASMSTARGGPGVVGYGDKLYVCGGGWDTYLTTCEQYSPASNTWAAFDPLNHGRRTLGMAALNGKLYAEAGWAGDFFATNEEYALAQTCYTLVTGVGLGGGGSVSANPAPNCNGGTQYTPGTSVQLSASAGSNFAFTHWSGDASGSSNPLNITMNSDLSIIGNFVSTLRAPTILRLYPPENSTACRLPQVGVKISLSNMVRNTDGSFDPTTVTLRLNGIDRTSAATITQNSTYPVTQATILYAPSSSLGIGGHVVQFMYPSPTGMQVRTWNFTAAAGTCPSMTLEESPPVENPAAAEAPAPAAEAPEEAAPSTGHGTALQSPYWRLILRR